MTNAKANKKQIREILGWGYSVTSAPVVITPSMATKLLVFNMNNRKFKPKNGLFYEKIIKNGEWEYTADAISFDENGILSNGQHRLYAISRCNVPCKCLVALDVNQSLGMDNGLTRSVMDNVSITDECCLELRDNLDVQRVVKTLLSVCNGYSAEKYSQKTMIGILNLYKDEFIKFSEAGLCKTKSKTKAVSNCIVPSTLFTAYMCGVPLAALTHIYEVLVSGEITSDYDKPILGCRDKLMTISGAGRELTELRVKYLHYCIAQVMKRKKAKTCKADEYIYKFNLVGEYEKYRSRGKTE